MNLTAAPPTPISPLRGGRRGYAQYPGHKVGRTRVEHTYQLEKLLIAYPGEPPTIQPSRVEIEYRVEPKRRALEPLEGRGRGHGAGPLVTPRPEPGYTKCCGGIAVTAVEKHKRV